MEFQRIFQTQGSDRSSLPSIAINQLMNYQQEDHNHACFVKSRHPDVISTWPSFWSQDFNLPMKPFPPIVAHCWTQKPSQGAFLSNSHAISFKEKTHQVLPGLSFCGAICAKGAECWRLGKVHVSQAFSQKVFLTRWCLKRQARGASFSHHFSGRSCKFNPGCVLSLLVESWDSNHSIYVILGSFNIFHIGPWIV